MHAERGEDLCWKSWHVEDRQKRAEISGVVLQARFLGSAGHMSHGRIFTTAYNVSQYIIRKYHTYQSHG